jgi:hypothetical protein
MPKNTFPGTLVDADLSALADEDVTQLDSGVISYVQDLQSQYVYDKLATDSPNGITIIKPNNPSMHGRWRLATSSSSNTSWANEPNWYINQLTGNDNNKGTTSNKPLKTFAELVNRVGNSKIAPTGGAWTVTFQTDVDVVEGSLTFAKSCLLAQLVGLPGPALFTGNIVAGGNDTFSPSTNTGPNETAGALPGGSWTASGLLNYATSGRSRQMVFQPGSSIAGYVMWAGKDLGALTALASAGADISLPTGSFPGLPTPSGGAEPFIVRQLPKIDSLRLSVTSDFVTPNDPSAVPFLRFYNLETDRNGDAYVNLYSNGTFSYIPSAAFYGCSVGQLVSFAGNLVFYGCCIAGVHLLMEPGNAQATYNLCLVLASPVLTEVNVYFNFCIFTEQVSSACLFVKGGYVAIPNCGFFTSVPLGAINVTKVLL